ncbi:hypothetical protein VSS98_04060 [Lactobacillus delbrueckii subsp. allosunkii]|uniref:hypothetical protein n=1 Tax=Lactobacillus delbrueckii TaxID=1584 RepID=UPI003A88F6B5
MEIHLDNQELREAVDQIMIDRGYLPMEAALGKRIGLDEFIKKYCPQHGKDWVKENIIYKYHPDWCKNANPGRGRSFEINEYRARQWMEDHWDEL